MKYESHGTPISDKMLGYKPGTGRVEIWRDDKGPPKIPVCKKSCKKCASGEHNEVGRVL